MSEDITEILDISMDGLAGSGGAATLGELRRWRRAATGEVDDAGQIGAWELRAMAKACSINGAVVVEAEDRDHHRRRSTKWPPPPAAREGGATSGLARCTVCRIRTLDGRIWGRRRELDPPYRRFGEEGGATRPGSGGVCGKGEEGRR